MGSATEEMVPPTSPVPAFIKIIRQTGLPGVIEKGEPIEKSRDAAQIVKLAELNKVALLYSLSAGENIPEEMLEKQKLLVNTLREVGTVFNKEKIRYTVFKTLKPFPTTPSDIDIIIEESDMGKATSLLESSGFQKTAQDAYSTTLQRGKMIVDLQLQPSVSNLPYISKEFLMQNIQLKKIEDFEVYNLTDEAEIIVVAAHSVYKEQLFTLSDYYAATILSQRVKNVARLVELAKISNTEDALRIINSLCAQITEMAFEKRDLKVFEISKALGSSAQAGSNISDMPLKFPFSLVAKLLFSRTSKDKEMRKMMLPAMIRLASPSQLFKLVSHFRRKTY